MTPEQKQQIDALIEAGEKATQGDAILNGLLEVLTENDDITNCCRNPEDGLFIRDFFNSREALKSMRDYVERLEEALEKISRMADRDQDVQASGDTRYCAYLAKCALTQSETEE